MFARYEYQVWPYLDKGPFKKYVTQNIEMFDPPNPMSHFDIIPLSLYPKKW